MPRAATRRWPTVLFALLAIAAGVLPISAAQANSTGATGAARSDHGTTKPTIVLVHGAWADASSWSAVIQRLQRDGYQVEAPPNPLRGLPGDADYLAAYLQTVPGPIVLVGHSYGGAVITNAATGNTNVTDLVYVDAFAPDQGESIGQLAGPDSALSADPATLFRFVPYPGAPAGDVDLYMLPSVARDSFAQDLPARQAAVLAAIQRPLTAFAVGAPSGAPAWKTIPSWYLVGTLDKVIPPAQQRFMAERAHARTVAVKASHVSMISHPGAVTDLIERAAR